MAGNPQMKADEQAILAAERRALDRWAAGDVGGYIAEFADDVSYTDDIGAHERLDGLPAVRGYFAQLAGKVPAHRYELLNPKLRMYGDTAVLTLRYDPFAPDPDGKPLTKWKETAVYRRIGGDWRAVHVHWSMLKNSTA